MSPRQIIYRGLMLGVFLASAGLGGFLGFVAWYTGTDRILPGVTVGGTAVGGLTTGEARERFSGRQERQAPTVAEAKLRANDQVWPLDLTAVGAVPNPQDALQAANSLGRTGPVWVRARQFMTGVVHGHYVPLEPNLSQAKLRERLTAIAAEFDRQAVDATYRFEDDTVTDEVPGRALDVEASFQAVQQAVREGRPEVALVVRELEPQVRREDLSHMRRHEVARFTTPILAADTGRVQNIAMAVKKISGVALAPGQVFSFNQVVGPRDAEHGWAQANELYQGEFVMGYGGGICQVSSTLYNSVLLAGLEIKERYHHDRPLQYVDPGRDATVAWNLLDFRFRNSTDVTILIGARILPGSPQHIEVSLYAPRPTAPGNVVLETTDVQYFPPTLEEIPDGTLPANQRKVVDEGHYGIKVKIYRVYQSGSSERRELVSEDEYRPKAGKVRVGVGNAPGSERLLNPGLR